MNYIDIAILVLIVLGAIRGFIRGLIIEVTTLLGLAAGIYASMKYAYLIEGVLKDFMDISPEYSSYVALSITFILVVVFVFVLGKLLTKLIDIILLGLVNKLLGAVMGAIKVAMILCVLIMIINTLNEKFLFIGEETLEKSILFYPFLNFAEKIYHLIRR